ncbi:MAG: hypothetical protein ACR2PR_10075 [Pseudohongiellaceae bacterium]
MNDENLKHEIEQLKAENARLKATEKAPGSIYYKVSQKGAVSVYGLGRFPVTLYKEQWQRLLEKKDDILAFIQRNNSDLKTKDS